MSNPTTSNCPVQIQIWVDDNAITIGQTTGVYLVDNRSSEGQSEGSANLTTCANRGNGVCWRAFLINPKSTGSVSIKSIGNSGAWGFSGQPQQATDDPSAFTGTVENAGPYSYSLSINVQLQGGSGVTVNLTPNLNVKAS